MTLIEAINRTDELKPNGFSQTEKVEWLSILDGMIKNDIIDTHEGGEDIPFSGYNDETPNETKLIVESPYDDIYILWLESRIDYANAEYAKYNNSITRYNDIYQAYSNYYNRTHMPKGIKLKYF